MARVVALKIRSIQSIDRFQPVYGKANGSLVLTNVPDPVSTFDDRIFVLGKILELQGEMLQKGEAAAA
eukprot:COSAG03_NODE_2449_length_2748_cov_14.372971_4_plen_68_part_00